MACNNHFHALNFHKKKNPAVNREINRRGRIRELTDRAACPLPVPTSHTRSREGVFEAMDSNNSCG